MSLVSPVQIVTGSMYAGGFRADDRLLSTASRNNAIRRETGKVELAFDRSGPRADPRVRPLLRPELRRQREPMPPMSRLVARHQLVGSKSPTCMK